MGDVLDLKALLSKILDAIKVDYVVEEGTSGNSLYRKWNSGKVELWYSESSSSGLNTSVWQSPINYGDYARASLWSGVFNNPPKVYASSNYPWVIAVLPTYISKDGCSLRFLTCGKASNQAYGFSIYAIGTWK